MNPKASDTRRVGGRFTTWLAYNPSGIPRRHAVRVALLGVGLGILGGLLVYRLAGGGPVRSVWALRLSIVSGSLSGAILTPLGVLLGAHLLDRAVPGDDHLVGYSGVVRMLLHAGELSFLGVLGGGIGVGSGGILAGILWSGLATSVLGAVLYRVRGFGLGLGLAMGVLTGALSGAIGGTIGRWGG
jgi:hypothetical protein